MIIKVFKVSTAEMWIMKNKNALIRFIEGETNNYVPCTLTVKQLIKYLPVEDYCRVK